MTSPREVLAGRRMEVAVRRRRIDRQTAAVRRALQAESLTGSNCLARLIAVGDTLDWLVVDARLARAYLRIVLASANPAFEARDRRLLASLHRKALEQLRHENRTKAPRGRRPALPPAQEDDAFRVYTGLLAFFQRDAHRPKPERPRDEGLLAVINAKLSGLQAPRALTLIELEQLTEETPPNRIAKVATGVVYGVSAEQVDKIVTRIRSKKRSSRR